MRKRTDIHRPSAIRPLEYEYIAMDYIGPSANNDWRFLASERQVFRAHQADTKGKFSHHDHGGSCHICGANAFYIAKFYHKKTNSYIVTGTDCAEKMSMGDPTAFKAFRKRVLEHARAEKGKKKAIEYLCERGLSKAWDIYMSPEYKTGSVPRDVNILSDILARLVKWGNLSEGQVNFLKTLVNRIENRDKIEAERAAKYATAKEVPVSDKRIKVTGVVLAVKPPSEWDRFGMWKMLVESTDGWKVWGSRPLALSDVERGSLVSFEAKVTRSDKDPKFGFFNRPSKPEIIQSV